MSCPSWSAETRVEMGPAVCEKEKETRLVRRSSRIVVGCEGAIGRSSPVEWR